jgi:hypothetical protein
VNYGEIAAAAEGVPWLAGTALALGATSWAVEKVAGLTGPATTIVRLWTERDLRRLRREALLRAERRRLDTEEESAVMADLRAQIAHLSDEVGRLRATVRRAEDHHRAVHRWAEGLLRAARAAGLPYVDPPSTDEQPVVESRNPAQLVPAPR